MKQMEKLEKLENKAKDFRPKDHIRLMKFLLDAVKTENSTALTQVLNVFENILKAEDVTNEEKRHIVHLLQKQAQKPDQISSQINNFLAEPANNIAAYSRRATTPMTFHGTYGFELEYVGPDPFPLVDGPDVIINLIRGLHGMENRRGYQQPKLEPDATLSSGWREYSQEFVTQILKGDDDLALAKEVMQTLKLFGAFRTKLTEDHIHIGAKQDAINKFKEKYPEMNVDDATIQKRFIQSFMIAYTHAIPEWHTVSRGESKYHLFNWRPLGHRIAGMIPGVPWGAHLYRMKDDEKNRAKYIERLNNNSKFDKDLDGILKEKSGNVFSKLQLLRFSLFNLDNLPDMGGKPGTVRKKTLEVRGMEHWLWKRMTVEPELLEIYIDYINVISGIAMTMAHSKIIDPDTNLEGLLDNVQRPEYEAINDATERLRHNVSLATFKAGLTDRRTRKSEDARYAHYVLRQR